ncbi:conserved hypothetical protein [Hyella patelloides LEGE 07179]|uniref:HNH nuclease domain-containing protein n=1 Tax=Hyella patelloides LEGE 07179 TaxID=945734 RepID=A0A563VJZ8_9CYAN|nr:DUF262 domain-containing protein [Hyella patelloides]VEP11790.1 conserved hypothetical protein [Hyella patelloides LEGE 07179]
MAKEDQQEWEVEIEEDIENIEEDTEGLIPLEKRELITASKDLSIRELKEQVSDDELKLDPSFQRYYVFDNKTASRLIESVLMNVPLPIIYLSEEEDGTNEVIDGQQRLTSFMRFLDNEFALTGLTVFKELNHKRFQDLPKEIKSKIKKSTLRCIVILKDSNPDIKFDIFERLNSGSVQLNRQELRNCVHRGSYSDLLKELASDPDWLNLIGTTELHKRMTDCEMILRFFAFYHGSNFYSPPISKFLNKEIETRRNASLDTINNLRQVFRISVKLTSSVFGENAFIRLQRGNNKNHNGKLDKKINMSLFDIVMVGFTRYKQRDIIPKADAIRNKLYDLMTNDADFLETIMISTSNKGKVQKRFLIWFNALDEIIGMPENELRSFSDYFKKELYDINPTCSICNQQIISFYDSVVDHKTPYSLGGKTEPANGRLTHRYCNFARGNRN